MNKERKSNIKIKVVLGYILVFLAIIASLFIAYKSYNQLLESVVTLSKPDAEIARMNRVLTNLSEAENKIRIYSLTKQEKYLEHYADNISEIQNDLDSLRKYSPDSSISVILIDSMNFFLEERADKLERFVKLKRSKDKEKVSQEALRKLSVAKDSAKSKIRTTTTTTTRIDTVLTAAEVKEKKKKKGLLARWFSGKEDENKVDSVETLVQRTEIKVDTSYLPQADTLLHRLDSILHRAQRIEELNRDVVLRQELRLVEENAIIWDKIKQLLRQLESERLEQLTMESNKAKDVASNAISVISIIIIVGFVFGVLFVIFILMDISKSNYYRKELLIAKGKAEKLAKVKEEFLATMSHEIRTPLNAIIGFTNQLNKTSLQEQQQKFVGVLKSSSKHLLGLVNEILDLSKLEAGKLRIENISFQPHSLVFDVYDVLKVNAENKDLEFNWDFHGNEDIFLTSDPFRIKQILLNLGSNAIKFTHEGYVRLNASVIEENDQYLFNVDVIDTGIGIADDKLESIFENFSQADSFSSRKYGGTGLGLSISRRLARLLGGDLYVDSELDKGSCFTLRIPLKRADEVVLKPILANNNHLESKLKNKSFLIADDDNYSLMLLQTVFKTWNLKADFVEDGRQAWKQFKVNNYDIVLTDIHMPEMGGIELCRRIRSLKNDERANIPIVALTANVRETDLQEYLTTGMTECLVKPFDEDILKNMLVELLVGEIEAEQNPVSNNGSDENLPMYDLTQLKQFTSDDEELIKQVLGQFIVSAEENIQLMNKALTDDDYLNVGEIAHKMLTSFNQLNVVNVVPYLKELEDLLHRKSEVVKASDRVKQLVDLVNTNSKLVIESIKKEV
jgi:signal transduction histidine kinase/response regulator RpfG family c-di-GMP phosphodiesterase